METSNPDRIIVLVDMDCFYVQVEQKLCPEYENKPCAVVQYKTYKGGGIIAVNYEARARGVSRMLRGDDARGRCPDIHLFRVPEVRGKADLTRYRDAGAKVIDVLCEYSDCVERASIDEAYLDMTSVINNKMQNTPPVTPEQIPNTFVVGWENDDPELRKIEVRKWLHMIYEEDHLYNDRMLAVAAAIVEEMRTAVFEKTGYRCSAGIAHNKMLAKLSCGIHKPNKQTVLPQSSIQLLYNTVSIKKVRNLGGKFGDEIVKKFNVEKMGDLFHIPKSEFVTHFGEKNGHWLYNIVRGIENEPVIARQLPKSIGCGKNFPGKASLSTKDEVTHWLKQLASELEERLVKDREANQRVARLLTISVRNYENNCSSSVSRSCPIYIYSADKLAHDALNAISKLNTSSSEELWKPSIWTLSMVASKFEDKLDNSYCNIKSYLLNVSNGKQEDGVVESDLLNTTSHISSESKVAKRKSSEVVKNNPWCKATKNSKQNISSFFKQKETNTMQSCENMKNMTENIAEVNITKCNEEIASVSMLNLPKEEISNNSISNENKEINKTDISDNSEFSVEKQQKPTIGFFAKKCAERSEQSGLLSEQSGFSFDIEFQGTSTDNTINEPFGKDNINSLLETACTSNPSLSKEIHLIPELNSYDKKGQDNLTNLDPELIKVCDKCSKCIPVWEESEHLDYHLALSLSNELSQKSISDQSTFFNKSLTVGKSGSSTVSKHKKNGRKKGKATKASSQAKKPVIQTNTLDTFFKNDV